MLLFLLDDLYELDGNEYSSVTGGVYNDDPTYFYFYFNCSSYSFYSILIVETFGCLDDDED